MNLNEFKSLVLSRQSCRSFSDKEIDVNDLKEILSTALLAPSVNAIALLGWFAADIAVNLVILVIAHRMVK